MTVGTAVCNCKREAPPPYMDIPLMKALGVQILRTYAIWNRSVIVLAYLLSMQFVRELVVNQFFIVYGIRLLGASRDCRC